MKSSGKWGLSVFRAIIVAIVAWGIWWVVRDAWDDLSRQRFAVREIRPLWLAAAGVLYTAGMLPMWWFWYQTLRALGQQPPRLGSARAFFVGHLGKYIPGKAMVVVLRTALIRGAGVDATVAAVSVFVETLTMMTVGAFVSGAIIAVEFADQKQLHALAWVLMVATGVPTLPPVFRRLVLWLKVARLNPNVSSALDGLTYRLMLRGWIAYAIGWAILSTSLWATLRAVPMGPPLAPVWQLAPRLTASVSLSVVAGFISLVPGGLGVRDLVLQQLMAPELGVARALVTVVLLRLVWLVTELGLSAILYIVGRGPQQKEAAEDAGT